MTPYRRGETMTALFAEAAARVPDGTAIVHGDRRVTYAELDAVSDHYAAALEECLARWASSRLPAGASVLSLDGKTARGSREGEVPGQHLVSAYAPQAEAVLGQLRVGARTNEHKAALRLLGILPLRGKVVIGDAAFCQRDLAQQVVEGGGDYIFTVKANQPGPAVDVAAGFGFEAAARSVAAAFSP